jgi:hypothetical protein
MSPEQKSSTIDTRGSIEVQKRRIVVTEGIGIAISVIFLLSSIFVLTLTPLSQIHRRPLGLRHDPGNIAVLASLVASELATRSTFNRLERSSEKNIEEHLQQFRYNLVDGQLIVMNKAMSNTLASGHDIQEGEVIKPPQKPILFRPWMGLLFVGALAALVGGIVALYKVSLGKGLQQRALVYEFDFSISNVATSFAPYSIIPTVFAVGIKLWYGAIEEKLKRLQPFSSMLQHPTPLGNSVLVEYENAPMILGAIKAARHGHWLLVLVGIGALATEICKSTLTVLKRLLLNNI